MSVIFKSSFNEGWVAKCGLLNLGDGNIGIIITLLHLCEYKIYSNNSKLNARKCSSAAGRIKAPDRMCRQFGGT